MLCFALVLYLCIASCCSSSLTSQVGRGLVSLALFPLPLGFPLIVFVFTPLSMLSRVEENMILHLLLCFGSVSMYCFVLCE